MRFSVASLAAPLIISTARAQYSIADEYSGVKFLQEFDFFKDQDPTNGHVQYQTLDSSLKDSLVGIAVKQSNAVYLAVDAKNPAPDGRASVRLSSKKTYNHGLFIADIAHMPTGLGTWPAFWLLGGGTWPAQGEVDILEGVNDQKLNAMTLHTSPGCKVQGTSFSGNLTTSDCDIKATNQPPNAGCSISSRDPASYGEGFNAVGGGVYATVWNSTAISIWHFKRSAIPADITSKTPDPKKWGQPVAQFGGQGCDDKHFQNFNIIINVSLCGQWAGRQEVWDACAECKAKAPTCNQFVTENPKAFEQAYWLINSVRVYNDVDGQ